jgi:hypothetical protein
MCVPFVKTLLNDVQKLSSKGMKVLCHTANLRAEPSIAQWVLNADMMAHTKRLEAQ